MLCLSETKERPLQTCPKERRPVNLSSTSVNWSLVSKTNSLQAKDEFSHPPGLYL